MNAQPALHPTDQTLQSYGLGKLDETSADSVNQHLESCDDCRTRVAAMCSDSFLGKLRDAQGRPQSTPPVASSLTGMSMGDGGVSPPAPSPASTLPPGLADHPDYRILRELGRGGMGVVYLAENTLMGRKEVLKVVGSHLISRPGVLDRFLREIRSAAKLHHPNIVAAYSALRLGESLVLAMEYVDGLDLARVVKAKGPLPVVHACSFIHQAALGLQHAHERGMVHRDIKPANLILSRDGKKHIVKVLDFGLAKVSSEGQVDSALTREGQMLGTPDYIAPEQIRDAQNADIRADIYSLGCTFYYLLSGGPPFGGDHLWDLYQAHFSMDATPLNLERPEVPVEVAAIVAKMMAKEPAKRFQTPGAVAQALLPFFKPGAVGSGGLKSEISQIGQPVARPGRTVAALEPTQVTAEMTATPAPAPKKSPAPTQPGSIFEGLIDLGDKDTLFDSILDRTPPETGPATKQQGPEARSTALAKIKRLGPHTWWAVAGALLFGLVVAWAAVILRVKTANGWIVLENVPENAVVEIDGDRVTVIPNGGESIQIEAAAGKHDVVVKRGNAPPLVKSVPVESGKAFKLTVRLESPAAPEPKKTSPPGVDTPPVSGTDVIKHQEPIDRTLFTKISGQWEVEGDELVQSDATKWSATLLFGDERWTDYDFTVDAMPVSDNSSFSLVFRSTSLHESLDYVVGGEGNSSCHVFAHWKEGSRRLPSGFTFRPQVRKWYTARVGVRGNHFACSLYDKEAEREVGRFDVEDNHQPNGRVGLETWSFSTFRFKNIKVTSPDGRVLWEGPPAIDPSRPTSLARPVEQQRPSFGENEGWVPLFNGKDLTGWDVDSGLRSCWRTGNGELVLTGPGDYRKSGFLLTRREYSDFLLKFDFQPSPNTNSGVAFWARPGEFFEGLPHHPQIELFDADKERIKNGSLIWSRSIGVEKILDPYRPVELKPAGVWNTMEVEVRGGILRLVINSREVFRSDLAKLAELPGAHPGLFRRSGRIGLQSGTGTVRFRNIMAKDLSVPR
jgi:serine/threonine protein kinase